MTPVTESLDTKLRDQDDQTISLSDAVLRHNMHRLVLLGQTDTKFDYVLRRTTAKITERCLQTRIFKLDLGKVHSPRLWFDSPAPHPSEQPNDQHSVLFLVRTDSEKHDDFDLTRRLLTEIVREVDEGSFISKAIPDSVGSCEKEIPARRAGIIEHAVCSHDDLSRGGAAHHTMVQLNHEIIAHQMIQDPFIVSHQPREKRMFDGKLNAQREDSIFLTLYHFLHGPNTIFASTIGCRSFPNVCYCNQGVLVHMRLSAHASRLPHYRISLARRDISLA